MTLRIWMAVGLACLILAPRAVSMLRALRGRVPSQPDQVDPTDQFQRLMDAAALLRELGLHDIAEDLAQRAAPRLIAGEDPRQPSEEVVDAKTP